VELILVALDKAVPDGVRDYYQCLAKELKAFNSGSVSGSPLKKVAVKDASVENLVVPLEPTLQRPNSLERLTELVEFLQTNNIGLAMIAFMAILLILNIFALWFIFKLNAKIEFVLSQVQASSGQNAHKEL
jgi:hypothetical protein